MSTTLDYYNKNAELFTNDTVNVQFEKQRNMLLKYLKKGDSILDLGCGSGRDSKAFIEEGYKVTAIDGSSELCKIASDYIGKEVSCIKFCDINYDNEFDGVWACASLLHLKFHELGDVFEKISKALKDNGFLYASFKYGNFEGERNGRYFTDLTESKLNNLLKEIPNLKVKELNITADARVGRESEKWLNIIIEKIK